MGERNSDRGYRHVIAIYRCDVVTSGPFKITCGNVKVELFCDERTFVPNEHRDLVVAAVEGAEYCSPALPPIVLDTRSQHLVLTTRSRLDRSEGQGVCEPAIDRVVAVLAALVSPELFRTLLFRGWLQGPPSRTLAPLCKAVHPITVTPPDLRSDYEAASQALAQDPDLRNRFSLMFRFIAKGLAEAPGEEAFIWLWHSCPR